MKYVHLCWMAMLAISLILLIAGAYDMAGAVFMSAPVVKMIGAALTGKQSNDGMR